MSSLTSFLYEEKQPVRVVVQSDEPWFVAADVCRVLDLAGDAGQHLRRLDNDEKKKASGTLIQNQGGPEIWIINESGLYNLIFRSDKPSAQLFRKWVTGEVLPSIRRTGSYQLPGLTLDPGDDRLDPPSGKTPGLRFQEERERLGYATRKDLAKAIGEKLGRITGFEEMSVPPKKVEDIYLLEGIGFDVQYWRTGVRTQSLTERRLLDWYRDAVAAQAEGRALPGPATLTLRRPEDPNA